MPPARVPKRSAKKHRACDECRTRKLACSKDPDGCERCRRENTSCHYSEQKKMGRPRKTQFIESTELTGSLPADSYDAGPPLFGLTTSSTFDSTGELGAREPQLTGDLIGPLEIDEIGRSIWHFGSSDVFGGPPINFSESGIASQEGSTPPELSIPPLSHLLNDSNQPSVNSSEPPLQFMAAPCCCLASMYLALSSLQDFPSDIASALKTVRAAAATASAAIWCRRCGSIVLEDPNPPIESFQNTMLLGTILPIIANGYHKLLKQIDKETEAADAAGVTKTFSLLEYGGLCGRQTSRQQNMSCIQQDLFSNAVEMPASQWRTTVRALLRVDIYGHEQGDFKHKGLKDLVAELEARQKNRHVYLDAYIEAGGLGHGMFGQTNCLPHRAANEGKPHGCLQILSIAKVAIDTLVIA